jgi:hypothetical protein
VMAGTEDVKKGDGEPVPPEAKGVAEEKAAVPAPESPASDSKALVVFEGEYYIVPPLRAVLVQSKSNLFMVPTSC